MSDTVNLKEKREIALNEQVNEVFQLATDLAKVGRDKESILVTLRKMNFVPEVIDLAFKLVHEKSQHKSAILHGDRYKSLVSWYHPIENPDSRSRWGRLTQILNAKGWPPENVDSLDDQSDDVVSCLASPKSNKPEIVKGLVLGYVQSGKTANFSAVIAKATDEGYKLVIVLSGRHNGLRSQTEKRLKSELVDGNNSTTFNLTDVGPDGDFETPTQHPDSLLSNEDKFALVVMKKNLAPLGKFLNWIKTTSPEILENCPVLIVDDEADEASVNNSKVIGSQTAINKKIREIINFLAKKSVCSYVGYTATPFANLLIDASEESDLFPRDFLVALTAPSSYTGAERLFGRASIDADGGKDGLDVIRNIEPGDAITKDDEETRGLPKSMREAILLFLLTSGERLRRGQLEKHITMLIHTSHLRQQHEKICSIVERFVTDIKISFENKDDLFRDELQKIWFEDILQTKKDCFKEVQLGTFEEALKGIEHFLLKLSIIKENSDTEMDERLNFGANPVWAIIVGGNTLSRGLTIEGLSTSYFHRTTDGYDTLLQMGRWFGFREGFLDLIRVYVTMEMEANFYHLATVEHEIRGDIDRMQKNGEKPIDISIKIRDHDRLKITNKAVLKQNAQISSKTLSGSKIQATHLFLDSKSIADHNFSCIKLLIQDCEKNKLKSEIQFQTYRDCLLYKNVQTNIALNFLRNYTFSDLDGKFNFPLLEKYVLELNAKHELNKWSVVVMSNLKKDEPNLLDLGVNGFKVAPVTRSCSRSYSADDLKNGVVIRTITAPKDDIIDLSDIEAPEIIKVLEGGSLRDIPDSAVRNLRPNDRPLILIYPLETHFNHPPDEVKRLQSRMKFAPIVAPFSHLFGIALVFPTTLQETFDSTYIYNGTLPR
jgi:hypothetical protein